ncbi:PREDICTED: neuropeptide CCHamide-1 receptor [Nicrophorus vespilloides]|uniref:Neuropeptide CCHamide-1 receptor n=1 Tax=Nicrophorus vespilloides TaxID=110193 RepID=A0ABM1M2N3_NICVS|nr:PREDICTED: neuropeptide CCHamide-1 receptor [Nicrophorus vespilloides]
MNTTEEYDNCSNISEPYTPTEQRIDSYVVPIVFLLIFIIGVLGNGTLCVIFLRHRTMRNVPNTYILSLSMADLLVIITCVPFTSIIYTTDNWPWGELMCKLSETVKDISIGVSIFTLTALSANRFFAIVDPLKKLHATGGSKKASRVTVGIAISIWIISIICAIPSALGSYLMVVTDKTGCIQVMVCYPFPDYWLNNTYPQVIVLSKFLFLYIAPLLVIGIFYMSMANHLIISTKNVPGELQGTQRQIKARKKVAITVLIFVMVFAVCLLPYHIFMLMFYFYPNFHDIYNIYWHTFRIVGFCLCYINSCANPVALYCVSGAFRKHFNRYLLCIKPKRNRCDTCQGHHATTMSMVSTNKRKQSLCNRKGRPTSINKRQDLLIGHETSITLLGNGNKHACSKM